MSALAAARRRLADLAAVRVTAADEVNEEDELTPAPGPTPPPTAPLNSSPSFTSCPTQAADLSVDPAFADWSGSLASGLSDRLLNSLRRQAAAGDADAAREAVQLADYLAACDRGEIEPPEHPNAAALRNWNRLCDERAQSKEEKPGPKSKPAGRPRTGTPLLPADGA